jgi:hypothetical protein
VRPVGRPEQGIYVAGDPTCSFRYYRNCLSKISLFRQWLSYYLE